MTIKKGTSGIVLTDSNPDSFPTFFFFFERDSVILATVAGLEEFTQKSAIEHIMTLTDTRICHQHRKRLQSFACLPISVRIRDVRKIGLPAGLATGAIIF